MGSLNNDGLSLELGLLADDSNSLYAGDGSVDINGNPASKSSTGGWKACPFILGSECCERLACFGTSINLVTYLTKKLHEGNISAARNVTTWRGTCYLSSLIGAFLADAYLSRFWTIAIFSIIYLVGMGTLTLSASVPALKPPSCIGPICPEASPAQYLVFYFGLYLIALGTGGIKPCVSSFGADQFDDTDSRERVKKGSFFNWFFLSINIGALVSSSLLVWIQDNKGWGLGFGIPTLFMGIAIFSFFAGSKLYRFQPPGGSPLTRVCQVVVGAGRKWWVKTPVDSSLLYELPPGQASAIRGSRKLEHTDEFRFLDKAAIAVEEVDESKADTWQLCTVTQVEELKILLRMFPIWATGVIFSAVYAQISIMFVEQGMVMDPNLWGFTIPPASLLVFEIISVIIWVPLYDRVLIPVVRRFTGRDRGFTELQRMGIGMAMFIFVGAVAAVVEMKRLQLVKRDKLVGPIMLTILWQIPQYFLAGAAEVFTLIGQLEFFYDQSSDAMRSICSAYALLTAAFGNYLSSFIMTTVAAWSRGTSDDEAGWIPDNLNEGHLDYFFWFLSGLSFMNLIVYLVCANNYKYKKTTC